MVTCTLKGGSRDNEVQEGISGSSQSSQILERMNGEGAKDPSTGPLITSQMNGCKSLPFEQLPVYHPIKSVKSDFYESRLCLAWNVGNGTKKQLPCVQERKMRKMMKMPND